MCHFDESFIAEYDVLLCPITEIMKMTLNALTIY